GFSFGDYLRCGAIAAQSPICRDVVRFAKAGGFVLGVCNGFQILTETGLLPGVLMRNAGLTFVAKPVDLLITGRSVFTDSYRSDRITIPIAHHDGNYQATEDELDRLDSEGRVAFRYAETPNGAARDIAGITSANGRILGMMPHPERAVDPALGPTDGAPLFAGLVDALAAA
ncbi:MAG: phosphoribosylformylglycinamidine synthase subunit PurQ, partial [Pseudomonadota bacterium]